MGMGKEVLTIEKDLVRVLVVSDSHKRLHPMWDLVKQGAFDVVIHLGDLVQDANDLQHAFPDQKLLFVKGNCDFYESGVPEIRLIQVNGIQILACHGHTFDVKTSLERYARFAKELEADVALFGHTHTCFLETHLGVWLMNPGSISLPRDGKNFRFGVIEIPKNQGFQCRLKQIKKT